RTLQDELQARSSAPTLEAAAPNPGPVGVDASEAYAAGDILPPLPALPALPEGPGQPPSLDMETAPASGVDPAALEYVAAMTASEAYRLLAEALGAGHGQQAVEEELTLVQDAVRMAAGRPEEAMARRLAEGSGRGREELELAVRAWRYGGVAALTVLEEEWTVEGESLARARAALQSAWDEDERPRLRAAHNRWTAIGASTQLRLGRDSRWWPYRKEGVRWSPAGPAVGDPATALAMAEGETSGDPTSG
ncbi:SWF or SNF family helicase, partial [Streptomyces sp. NPDC057757]